MSNFTKCFVVFVLFLV
ncbi:hypothetical protein MTO96_050431, partial [Rhipicephalus appendiculatus]